MPSDQRGALVDRFNQAADCRLFLSTDAGGVGLNLQHAAATVVNMDLPWNPAKLEQRIGRVHRMGQRRGVQVINLVAQGSIEQGMLGVLAFKQSLFAGVLDGGDSAVFMNGTRLSKFMESVGEVTEAMGAAEEAVPTAPAAASTNPPAAASTNPPAAASSTPPVAAPSTTPVGGAETALSTVTEMSPADPATPAELSTPVVQDDTQADLETALQSPTEPALLAAAPPVDPWAPLLSLGLQWLESLASPAAPGHHSATAPRIVTNPETGARSLNLPLPDPATVARLAEGLAGLLAQLKR